MRHLTIFNVYYLGSFTLNKLFKKNKEKKSKIETRENKIKEPKLRIQ